MDDDYIVRWVIKELTPEGVAWHEHEEGVAWHEHEEICGDLTTAERYFTQLKKDPNIIEARILWGDVDIKNYRRETL